MDFPLGGQLGLDLPDAYDSFAWEESLSPNCFKLRTSRVVEYHDICLPADLTVDIKDKPSRDSKSLWQVSAQKVANDFLAASAKFSRVRNQILL